MELKRGKNVLWKGRFYLISPLSGTRFNGNNGGHSGGKRPSRSLRKIHGGRVEWKRMCIILLESLRVGMKENSMIKGGSKASGKEFIFKRKASSELLHIRP